jgi:hypothetical protein
MQNERANLVRRPRRVSDDSTTTAGLCAYVVSFVRLRPVRRIADERVGHGVEVAPVAMMKVDHFAPFNAAKRGLFGSELNFPRGLQA